MRSHVEPERPRDQESRTLKREIDVATLWSLGGLTWRELAENVWEELAEDRILGRAAQLSFYFLLSLFPLLMIMVALLNRFGFLESALRDGLARLLDTVAPQSASTLVDDALQSIAEGIGAGGTSFGLLIALWAASSGMAAIMSALNYAYEIVETRPWWKRRLVAICLVFALMSLIVMALILIVYGTEIVTALATGLGLGGMLASALRIVEWPAAVVFVLLVFNLLYLYAPNLKHRAWHWLMPGTAIAVGLWLLASYGFKLYVENFGTYNKLYGSVGTVVVLLLWFYITGIAILIGAQVNSVIEFAAANKVRKV